MTDVVLSGIKFLEITCPAILTLIFLFYSKKTNPFLNLSGLVIGIYLVNNYYILIFIIIILTIYRYYFNKNLITIFFIIAGLNLMQISKLKTNILQNMFSDKELNASSKVVDINNYSNRRIKEKVLFKTTSLPYNLSIMCYLTKKTDLQIGDIVEIKNLKLSKQNESDSLTKNPSFNEYIKKEKIDFAIFPKILKYKKVYSGHKFQHWLSYKRTQLSEHISSKLDPTTAILFKAIFLGEHVIFNKEKFNTWGITHYLARSGLHVAILILSWKKFMQFLPLSIHFKNFFLLIMCIVYWIFSWPSISFLRAFIVFILFFIGKLLERQTDLWYLLTLTCFIITAYNPMQIFFLDFQLSFGLTFALLFLARNKQGHYE